MDKKVQTIGGHGRSILSNIRQKVIGHVPPIKKNPFDIDLPTVEITAVDETLPIPRSQMRTYEIFVVGDSWAGKEQFTVDLVSHYFSPDTFNTTIENEYISRVPLRIIPPPDMMPVYKRETTYVILQITHDPHTFPGCILDRTRREALEKTADAYIGVYSITSRGTFQSLQREISGLCKKRAGGGAVGAIPMLIVGNKCDKIIDRELTKTEAEDTWGKERVREVSFVTKEGVDGLLEDVVGEIWRSEVVRDIQWEKGGSRLREGIKSRK